MKKINFIFLLFALSVIFSTKPVEAQTLESYYKIAGRGIQNEVSKEIILMACVGESLMSEDRECNVLQLMQLLPGMNPVFLGNSFHSEDIPQIREELSQSYSESSIEGMFSFLKGNATYAFHDQNGWNWSNNPLVLAEKKYDKVVKTVLYHAEYKRSLENAQKRKEQQVDQMATEQGIKGYRGVYVAQVKEKGSNRSIIYSATESELVFSLFSRGTVTELKSIKLKGLTEDISLNGSQLNMNLLKKLANTSKNGFISCWIGEEGDLSLALSGVYIMLVGVSVSASLCVIIPAAPFLAGLTLAPAEAAIDLTYDLFSTKDVSKRKFSKLMKEHDIKASHRVFKSMIEQIKAL